MLKDTLSAVTAGVYSVVCAVSVSATSVLKDTLPSVTCKVYSVACSFYLSEIDPKGHFVCSDL